jgi:transcriptional regulator with XRE-family HTH domain
MRHTRRWEDIWEAGQKAAETLPFWWTQTPLGVQLWALRDHRGISQRQLADEAGLRQSVVSRLEGGADARWSTWRRLFEGLGYYAVLLPVAFAEESQDLCDEERDRRVQRQLAGLTEGRWGRRWRR